MMTVVIMSILIKLWINNKKMIIENKIIKNIIMMFTVVVILFTVLFLLIAF